MRASYPFLLLTDSTDLLFCVSQPDDGVFAPEAHVVMQMTVDDIVTLIYSYVQVGVAAAVTDHRYL